MYQKQSLLECIDATEILNGWQSRDKSKSNDFFVAAYQDIYSIVQAMLEKKQPHGTLFSQSTATELTHEAILKLNKWRNDETPFTHRKEFVDYVRCSVWHLLFADHESSQQKEHKKKDYADVEQLKAVTHLPDYSLSRDLYVVLTTLRSRYPEQADAFEYKHFAAASNKDIALMQNVSERTVNNRLLFATNYLRKALS
ncbi:ECF-type sigma factor [Enterovibrio nigricans]|uniref:DNA-directed RNA polymerase specialized sigma subunit, sigma24 family n=1 Tax=Enterovibrio nigricans DSM 22720 TaxID=1121868 RepID=A0A1T4UVF3_9GAMM|nr:ECF-type sigma factor [Enterovibrio nigricans]PKF50010.1 hypothetical protein AT251_14710 [Enterovibrio nigricans]SKA56391.1 DNA-directed RNA polymerase specialized sigma subunit, sigma24 family [Enterovibrio nigricans DSM 22720]